MIRFSILIFAITLLGSCANDQTKEKEEFDSLFAEVMVIHDDVMPETNNLYKLKKFAQENISILPDTSSFIKKLMDVQLFSDKADDAMMEWMADFKIPDSDHKSKMAYLKNQKQEIQKVRELMLSTIYEGKLVINASDKFIKKNKLKDDFETTLVPSN